MTGLLEVPKLLWRPVRGVVRTVSLVPRALESVLVLPTLAEQLDSVDRNTDALVAMLEELRKVRADTASLPPMQKDLDGMLAELKTLCGDTTSLPLVHEEIAAMRETIAQVERNTYAVERLAEVALPLQGAAARVGRFADRLPQRRPGQG